MKLFKTKKGTAAFDDIMKMAIAVAGLAIALIVAFLVMSTGKTNIGTVAGIDANNETECATSVACNASNALIDATATIPSWVSLIILVVIGAILLGLIQMFRRRN